MSPTPTRPTPIWSHRTGELPLDRPLLMGILNVTPDSFSDGGLFLEPQAAAAKARSLVAEGADVIDIGGESTRPGADPVPQEEELRRVVPVVEAAASVGVPLSVDTRRASVAAAAIRAGASIINDVTALGDPAMGRVVADSGAGLILMHMRGNPRTMQSDPNYADVVESVATFLKERMERAEHEGVGSARIALDPGLGFGKTLQHNLALLAGLPRLTALGRPVVVGASRKRMIGTLTGTESAGERVYGSVGAALAARAGGAAIVRVHDVRATRDALSVFEAVRRFDSH